MRPGISVTVTAADRRRPEAIAGDRNSPQKHVWPRALPPPADLDALARAVVFAGALFRDAAVLDTAFLETARFCLPAAFFFAAGRPGALLPRPDLEAVVFGDLAIRKSFERCISSLIATASNSRRCPGSAGDRIGMRGVWVRVTLQVCAAGAQMARRVWIRAV